MNILKDIKNITKLNFIIVSRVREVLLWLIILPVALTLIGVLSNKDPNTAFNFLKISCLLTLFMSGTTFLSMFIANARFQGGYIQYKLSGYNSKTILLSQSLVMVAISTLASLLSIILYISLKGTYGFETAGGMPAIINIIIFVISLIIGSILLMPCAWLISSIGHDSRITQLYGTVMMMIFCFLGGVYYPTWAIKNEFLKNIIYLTPPGAVGNLVSWASGAPSAIISTDPLILIGEAVELLALFIGLLTTAKFYFKWEK